MTAAVPDWPRIIRQSSPADLGWSAGSPAPQEALDAIDEARDTGLRFLAGLPFAERYGPFTWWPESSRVAALLIADRGTVRTQVDPRTRFAEALGPSRSAALLIRAHRDGRARRAADGLEAVRRAGREAWRTHQQRGGGLNNG